MIRPDVILFQQTELVGMMPRAYSLDWRERLIDAVEAGSFARAAARRLQVSASTAVKWVQRKRKTGSVEAKPMHAHPPARLLPHKDRLLRLVAGEPDLTLKQIGERLAVDGIHVSKSYLTRLQARSAEGRARHAGSSPRCDCRPGFHTFLWRNRIRLKKDRLCCGTEPAGRQETA
jgi:transposase